jgi:hypothetical protein
MPVHHIPPPFRRTGPPRPPKIGIHRAKPNLPLAQVSHPRSIPCIPCVLPLPARPRAVPVRPTEQSQTHPSGPARRSPSHPGSTCYIPPTFRRPGSPRLPKTDIHQAKPNSPRLPGPPAASNPMHSLGVTSTCRAWDRAQPACRAKPNSSLRTRSPRHAASRLHLLHSAPFRRTGPPRPPKTEIHEAKPNSHRRPNPPTAPKPMHFLGVTCTCPVQGRERANHRAKPNSPRRHLRPPAHLDIIEQGMFRSWIPF